MFYGEGLGGRAPSSVEANPKEKSKLFWASGFRFQGCVGALQVLGIGCGVKAVSALWAFGGAESERDSDGRNPKTLKP